MDFLSIFALVPKLALVVLIVVGAGLIVEVFYLNKQRQGKRKKKEDKERKIPEELKEAAQPLKFPEVEREKTPRLKLRQNKALLLVVVLFLLTTIPAGIYLALQRQEIRKEAEEITPTPTLPPIGGPQCLNIKVYKVIDNNWEDWTQKLSSLKEGEEIKIAVLGAGSFTSARFKVNGEVILPDPATGKNPFDEFYVDYTIPAGIVNFNLEVELL